ncbi:MAG: trigger factor [Terriglobales bacterium]
MASSSECIREVEVEVPAGEVEREYTRIAQGIQKRARIHGFRPGKAPLSLVRQHFNAKIREETLETLVPAHLRAAFERDSLEPVSQPRLSEVKFEPGEALKFKASFEVLPPFDLGDYKSIRAEVPTLEVSDAEVEAAVQNLRERHSHLEPSEASEVSDGLTAIAEARPADAPEPATEEQARQSEITIDVGAEATVPEFSAALRGMKIGEERDLEVNYPGDFPDQALQGQTRRYHLKLNSIQKKTLPELTDPAITETLGTTTADEARAWVRQRMEADRKHTARHAVEEKVLEALVAQVPFAVPQTMVDKRVEDRIERNLHGLARQGVNLRKLEVDWAKLRERHLADAERDVRAGLLLDRIASQENLAATSEEVDAEVQQAAAELRQTPDSVRARLTENGGLDRIQNSIRHNKALAFLVESATAGGFGREPQATGTTAAKE